MRQKNTTELTALQSDKVKSVIKELRAVKGITVKELAMAMGIDTWKLSHAIHRHVTLGVFYKLQDYVESQRKKEAKE